MSFNTASILNVLFGEWIFLYEKGFKTFPFANITFLLFSDSILAPAPTKRQLTAMELMQTETTYIRNLKIIVEVTKMKSFFYLFNVILILGFDRN